MFTTLTAVWLLHMAATVTPVTNTLLVTQLAASHRGPAAMFAAAGVAVGSAAWAAFAVLGVHLVFTAFPVLRLALQVAGGLYLLYVALRLWASASTGHRDGRTTSLTPAAAFRRGVLTNFTNPKAALFFGSIFSTCLPASPGPGLLGATVAVVFVNALGWYSLLAYLFTREPVRAAYDRKRHAVDRLAGAVLGALGLRILLASLREAK